MSQVNDSNKPNAEDILKTAQFDADGVHVVLGAAKNEEVSDTASATEQSDSELKTQLEAALAQATEGKDALLRAQAEMENQRRRYEKQVEDAHKFSVQRFVEGLLPVMDSLEMGLQTQGDINSIKEGMLLTLKQFESALNKFKVEAINPVNQPFNPEQHQAVTMLNSPSHDNGNVVEVLQKGYTLNGRTVRPAMVVVCKK